MSNIDELTCPYGRRSQSAEQPRSTYLCIGNAGSVVLKAVRKRIGGLKLQIWGLVVAFEEDDGNIRQIINQIYRNGGKSKKGDTLYSKKLPAVIRKVGRMVEPRKTRFSYL